MPAQRAVRIVYGPTGGRYPMMYGVAEALESKLHSLGVKIIDRVGISGGALVAAGRSGKESFDEWINRCIYLSPNLSLWGMKTPQNLWNFVRHGGFLNSAKIITSVFSQLLIEPPQDPCYAISWCKSAQKAVAFPLTDSTHAAKYLFASAAVPIAFSPVKIQNKDLPPSVVEVLGVDADKGYSTFQDGGLSDSFPADLIGGGSVPTIMVFIDPIPLTKEELETTTEDVWDKFFGLKNKANLLAISARRRGNTQILVVPSIEGFNKYRLRFDMDLEMANTMYKHGKVMTEHSFQLFLSFPEELDTEDSDGKGDTDQGLSIEHALSEIVPSQDGENQVAQAVGEQSDAP